VRGPAGNILRVRVMAPNRSATNEVQQRFQALIGQPLNTATIETLLGDIRSDGRYDANYTVTYESGQENRPSLLVTVTDKKTGPPFLELGANIQAESGISPRPTVEGILLNQDLGGYGSELRTHLKFGWLTDVSTRGGSLCVDPLPMVPWKHAHEPRSGYRRQFQERQQGCRRGFHPAKFSRSFASHSLQRGIGGSWVCPAACCEIEAHR
jgi:hypothetical protein